MILPLTSELCLIYLKILPYFDSEMHKYGKITLLKNGSISPYSVRMRENGDQNNFEYGHFSRSVINCYIKNVQKFGYVVQINILLEILTDTPITF